MTTEELRARWERLSRPNRDAVSGVLRLHARQPPGERADGFQLVLDLLYALEAGHVLLMPAETTPGAPPSLPHDLDSDDLV